MRSHDILRVTNSESVTAGFRLPASGGEREEQVLHTHPRCRRPRAAAASPPEMLPVEKTRTEIMKPKVSAMSVMKGTESGAAGDVTTVAVPFTDGNVMDVVDVGACSLHTQLAVGADNQLPLRLLPPSPLTACTYRGQDAKNDTRRANSHKNCRCKKLGEDGLSGAITTEG